MVIISDQFVTDFSNNMFYTYFSNQLWPFYLYICHYSDCCVCVCVWDKYCLLMKQ